MSMNIVPIAFAFDNNLVLPACVCISSLMMNACKDTFYDIFILYSKTKGLNHRLLDKFPEYYPNCKIQYREVGETFDKSFEVRGVTTPTYYRLLISELVPEYEKILYADVDIIFRLDLAGIYNIDMGDNYFAGTYDLGMNLGEDGQKYIASMPELSQGDYLQAGFILLNSKMINKDGLVNKFKKEAKRKLRFQDQDILNIACKGKVYYLPPCYNMTDYSYTYMIKDRDLARTLYAEEEIAQALDSGNIHFNGHKPWKKYSVNFDIWWEYYRKSPCFDEKFYFDFFYSKLNELDQLSLWKRVKILVRYFIYGRMR